MYKIENRFKNICDSKLFLCKFIYITNLEYNLLPYFKYILFYFSRGLYITYNHLNEMALLPKK